MAYNTGLKRLGGGVVGYRSAQPTPLRGNRFSKKLQSKRRQSLSVCHLQTTLAVQAFTDNPPFDSSPLRPCRTALQVLVNDPKELEKIREREADITKERIQKILDAGANVILTTKVRPKAGAGAGWDDGALSPPWPLGFQVAWDLQVL